VAEGKVQVGSIRAVVPKRRVTTDMFWPEPEQPPTPAPELHATVVLTEPEPTVTLEDPVPFVEVSDCGNGCGKAGRCAVCRAEIRDEALRWLRELNVVRKIDAVDPYESALLTWGEVWSREFLLA
jgi:hypothetical protein